MQTVNALNICEISLDGESWCARIRILHFSFWGMIRPQINSFSNGRRKMLQEVWCALNRKPLQIDRVESRRLTWRFQQPVWSASRESWVFLGFQLIADPKTEIINVEEYWKTYELTSWKLLHSFFILKAFRIPYVQKNAMGVFNRHSFALLINRQL